MEIVEDQYEWLCAGGALEQGCDPVEEAEAGTLGIPGSSFDKVGEELT